MNNNQLAIPFSVEYIEALVEKMSNLYVMTRHKYLTMYKHLDTGISRWNTVSRGSLTDNKIASHLCQQDTLGVFSGKYLSKFICFDIDSKSVKNSKLVASLLRDELVQTFYVPKEYIHINFSGKKGYHIEIFFDEALPVTTLQTFYDVVMLYMRTNYMFTGEIEFRPTYGQGVKLPLSIHHETNKVCWFVNRDTLEPIQDYNYLLTIEPLNVEVFKETVLNTLIMDELSKPLFHMQHEPAIETETLLEEVKPYVKDTDTFSDDMETIMKKKRLLRNNSRNDVTFHLATYLHNQGFSKEKTRLEIVKVLDNTWNYHRHMFSSDTPYEHLINETFRVVDLVFRKNYQMDEKPYKLYKSEILQILEQPTKTLRKLLFSLYIHSKKYAKQNGEFFMAYSVMAEMGNCTYRTKVLQQLIKLEENNVIEIVKRNETNKALTYEANRRKKKKTQKISETNVYKVTLNPILDNEPYLEVSFGEEVDYYGIVKSLVSEKEAKEKLPKNQFYNEYKPIYKEA